jgi:DNA-binding CsgD family transcriptional regulator
VKAIRSSDHLPSIVSGRHAVPHRTYFFYEKQSGAAHFRVNAGPDGMIPLDQAACLLAMHCMVRGQSPEDYVVMVEADPSYIEGLAEKAQKLLEAGQSVKNQVKVTRREEEVLRGILRGLANKEIAGTLNLSERTVKFHVSSLLSKFRVRGRMELVREASQFASTVPSMTPLPTTREARQVSATIQRVQPPLSPASVFPVAKLGMPS